MFFLKRLIAVAVIATVFSLTAADTDLSGFPKVKYVYLDENFKESTAEKLGLNDKTMKMLKGVHGPQEGLGIPWAANKKKMVTARFEFPEPVAITGASSTWLWPFNQPKAWVDAIEVYSGNTPDEHNLIMRSEPGKVPGTQGFPVSAKFKEPVTAKYFTVRVIQEAHPEHVWFALGNISLSGDDKYCQSLMDEVNPEKPLNPIRKYPCNLFDSKDPVQLRFIAREGISCELKCKVTDAYGNVVQDSSKSVSAKKAGDAVLVSLGKLKQGYFSIDIENKEKGIAENVSISVFPVTNRTAAEALKAGARFGIQGGFGGHESSLVFRKMGMPWKRDLLFYAPLAGNDPEHPDFRQMNSVIPEDTIQMFEVKTVPTWCAGQPTPGRSYDGCTDPIMMVPKDPQAYMKYTRQLMNQLKGDGGFYEIWNEPWYMPGDEFAKIALMTEKAIRQAKPKAVVGTNLGRLSHMEEFIKAGGLKTLDFLSIHPYSDDFKSSPEVAKLRKNIRGYHELMKKQAKRDIPIYVTEIGWPTPKGGKMANTEAEQAYFTVRASLIMYAEDVKGIMPYCIGQSETDPNEKEHFFGMVRKNLQPKPVLAAYAATAKMLEGAKYLGDLKLNLDTYTMLFRLKNGKIAAAVYADGRKAPFTLNTYATRVQKADMYGNFSDADVKNGKIEDEASDWVVWYVGLGEKIIKEIVPDNLVPKRNGRVVPGSRELPRDAEKLSQLPGVKYVYLDEDFNEVRPDGVMTTINDPEHKHMNDGKSDPAVVPVWGLLKKKNITVRYEFPAAIQANGATILWMWSFNQPKHWIDRIDIYAGMNPMQMKHIVSMSNDGKIPKGQAVEVKVPFGMPVTAKYIAVSVVQEQSSAHDFFGIGEVSIFGPKASVRKLQSATPAK